MEKLWTSFLSDFMYLHMTVVHKNIKMFTLFLYIFIFSTTLDNILISCQPMLKLPTYYDFHESFLLTDQFDTRKLYKISYLNINNILLH